MKRLVCLIIAMSFNSICEGNIFTDATGDHYWGNPDNWSDFHIPNSCTLNGRANAVSFLSNTMMNIGSGEDRHCYGFHLGVYGSGNDVVVNIDGGSLCVGPWGVEVGFGDSGYSDYDTTVNMTGGVIKTSSLMVPRHFDNSGTVSDGVGVINASSGVINANFLNIGMGDGVGTVNLSGDAVVNLDTSLQMNTFLAGWDELSLAHTASLVIDDSAHITIGGYGDYTPGPGDPTIEEIIQMELDIYQAYIDFGWITSNTGPLAMNYNEATDTIVIVPEPATMLLLGLGVMLVRRKKLVAGVQTDYRI
ncbi:MAG: PEP-CTERM sorting domain-containing protein [Phycisphaerae bacterium]|nr:PEP-CTERM sorting domain-containing protein [Phycisphaerae bacterium]